MSLNSGQARLQRSTQVMLVRWRDAKVVWRDQNALLFQKEFINTWQSHARTTATAMQHMQSVIHRVRRDCGE